MAGQLLSAHGCGRATAYPQENKIVTLDDRVHVAWLDSVAEGFRVRIRTLDRASGTWSATHTIGEAYDNHGGPALVCDSQGYLHVAYYPHHHAIRYRRSLRPNDASAWTDEELIGDGYSYPKLAVGRNDELLLSCRRSFLREGRLGHERPFELHLLRKSPGGSWSEPLVLARSRHPNYAHFGDSYAWAPDRVGLHMTIRFHEKSDAEAYGRIQTVGYLFSPDAGRTWQRSDGTQVTLPVTAETVDVIAAGGLDYGSALQAGALAVAPDGTPWLVHNEWSGGVGTNTVCTPAGNGSWRRIVLNEHVELEAGRCFGLAPSVVFDAAGPAGRRGDHRRLCRRGSMGPSGQRGRALRVRRRRRDLRPGAGESNRSADRALVCPPGAAPGDRATAGIPRHPLPGGPRGRQPQGHPDEPGDLGAVTILSAHGCGRATAYPQENKIVTLGDAVHVAWLDSVADGFRGAYPHPRPRQRHLVCDPHHRRGV